MSVHTLGVSGAAPLLETLCLIDISVTDPAITELCESIKRRRVLQHLRKLELRELFEAPQDVINLMGAIGHGCPEVRSVRLWCDYRKVSLKYEGGLSSQV